MDAELFKRRVGFEKSVMYVFLAIFLMGIVSFSYLITLHGNSAQQNQIIVMVMLGYVLFGGLLFGLRHLYYQYCIKRFWKDSTDLYAFDQLKQIENDYESLSDQILQITDQLKSHLDQFELVVQLTNERNQVLKQRRAVKRNADRLKHAFPDLVYALEPNRVFTIVTP